ncbi:NADPH:quinone reductase [Acidovorax sp. MR-S7]|nr:NADPH:quinone reductase [Acidovorax sp. MR-S7]
MRAVVCRSFTGIRDLQVEQVATPQPARDEVQIEVAAAGVNFSDTLKVQGLYQEKPDLPWIPGGELSGVVSQLGRGVTSLSIGDRVLAVTGNSGGAFAEMACVPVDHVIRIPDRMTYAEGAAIPNVYGTAFHALKQRAQLSQGDVLLVLGASGGVGMAAVQLGKALGAKVLAAASTEPKRRLVLALGADAVIDYSNPLWREEVFRISGSDGVDVVFDPVGGDMFDEAIRCVGWMGRYLVVGFTSGRIPSLAVNRPLLKSFDVQGVRYDVWRSREWPTAKQNLEQVITLYDRASVTPFVGARYALEDVRDALQAIAGRHMMGKIVLCPRDVTQCPATP